MIIFRSIIIPLTLFVLGGASFSLSVKKYLIFFVFCRFSYLSGCRLFFPACVRV